MAKQIGVMQMAEIHAGVFGFVGLVLGVLYGVGGLFVDLFTTGLNMGSVMALGAVVAMPLLGGAFGFVLGLGVGVVWKLVPEKISF